MDLSYSPDGKYIICAAGDNTLKIWYSANGNLLRILEGHQSYICSASYSCDGKYIISTSGDRTMKIWDSESGQLIETIYHMSAKIMGADLKGTRYNDLTEIHLRTLKQNGVIVD